MAKFGDYTEDTTPADGDLILTKDVSATATKKVTLLNLIKALVSYVSSFTAASTLDGTELVPISQGGNARKVTTQAIADLGGGGGGTPGGSNTQIQFNDGGAFGGDAGLVYDKTTDKLTVAGVVQVGANHPNGLQYDSTTLLYGGGSTVTFYLGSGNRARIDTVGVRIASDGQFNFAGSTDATQAADVGMARAAAGIAKLTNGSTGNGALQLGEIADPSAPSVNLGTVYVRDNGSGKSQLCIRFNTGAVQVIATEP